MKISIFESVCIIFWSFATAGVAILAFICFILPFILTIINGINIFKEKKIEENLVDITTFLLGIILTILLFLKYAFKDYTQALRLEYGAYGVHTPIATWSLPAVLIILSFGIISYCVLRKRKSTPLIIVGAMSGTLICSAYMLTFVYQLSNNFSKYPDTIYLTLFPINYVLCSIRAQMEAIKIYKAANVQPIEYENKFLNKCSKILYNTNSWPVLAVIFTIPMTAILVCILVLFGQRPDEGIQAFLETSDWALSTKISPPTVRYYGEHYLCTVSLRGHKNIVKPIRMGYRRGEKIVVNRQLCVANAFEDLIQERTPRFHHFIRYIYDKYGYPLSKHINTAIQADIIYIIMKPLEWIFLAVLYLFDEKPENRIAMQYTKK